MPTAAEALSIAIERHRAGRFVEAEQFYRRALNLAPDNPEIYNNLGTLLKKRGSIDEAIVCFRRAIELLPNSAAARINLASALQDMGLLEEAISCYRQGLELRPELANVHFYLGVALRAQGQLEDAAASYRRAIALKRDYVDAYINLGAILNEQGRLAEEIELYQRALQFQPPSATLYHNLAATLQDLGKLEEAAACYRRAIELAPELAASQTSLAHLGLLTGDFENGWPQYEWRWKTGELPRRDFDATRWNGESLRGKTILLHAEQGLGDTIQFIRYAPLVKALEATIILECQQPLEKLLANCPGVDQLITEGVRPPPFDYHVPLLSLPGILKTTLDTIPASIPYLFADKSLVSAWHERLSGVKGFRIGINWHGRRGTRESVCRDIPLELFSSLAQIPNVQLISLQKSAAYQSLVARIGTETASPSSAYFSPEPTDSSSGSPIIALGDFDTRHGAFMDTAAIMMNLDLVITSDTSIAHLAGALGVHVWIALPFVPNWRWLLGRSDSPWYPTMRLFRQQSHGDWPGVFERIQFALREQTSA